MKLKFWILVFAIAMPEIMFSQLKLTVEIANLRSSKGLVFLEFMDENQKVLKEMKAEIKNNKCLFVISDLKHGKYAFRYLHDENNNSKMDKSMMGIPKEGFGFSNNAKGNFGPPAFNKWLFDLKSTVTMSCNPTYM